MNIYTSINFVEGDNNFRMISFKAFDKEHSLLKFEKESKSFDHMRSPDETVVG